MSEVVEVEETVEEEVKAPVLSIFVDEGQFGYDTDLSPEESIFWLEATKISILNRVVGESENG
jgi:hypothetical protein